MGTLPRPVSLAAERAVRYLRGRSRPLSSSKLAAEILATQIAEESAARSVLEAAFAGDSRLVCEAQGWTIAESVKRALAGGEAQALEPDRVLIFLEGGCPDRGKPFQLHTISVLRLRGENVVGACGGDTPVGRTGEQLRKAVVHALEGAVAVVHDPPGALVALEKWLGVSIDAPISLRRLAQVRLGLRASHTLELLVAQLGLTWRATEDPLEQADTLDACLRALRRPGESFHDLRLATSRGARPIDWSRFAFDRELLNRIPQVPGTYRFYDTDDRLLYVGKSKNLNRRIASYFREGLSRSQRVQELLDRLHRIEYEHSGSELEAILREAEQIRCDKPTKNVQRGTRPSKWRKSRLRSILILESAEPPSVLRAYLIHEERLVGRVSIGPRGRGISRIERLLDDYFFFGPDGPTPVSGPDLDVELIVRWLAANRDRVVAFDPTTLKSANEVVTRLRWFLDQGSPFDPDGSPVFLR